MGKPRPFAKAVMDKRKKKVLMHIRMDPKHHNQLLKIAKQQGISINEYVRRALALALFEDVA